MADLESKNAISRDEAKTKLTEMYGEGLNDKLQVANNVMAEFGGEDFLKALQESGLQNDPRIIKGLVDIGIGLGEDKIIEGGPGSASAIDDLKEEAAAIKGGKAYWDGEHAEHKIAVQKYAKIVDTLTKYKVSI